MFKKKIILKLSMLCFLGACAAPTAMIGPVYTFSSTGNILQAGLSYSSGELITKHTGKTPLENLKDASIKDETNIQKETLESEDFFYLVKARFEKTSSIFKNFNQ